MAGRARIHASASARAAAADVRRRERGIARRTLLLTPEAQAALRRWRAEGDYQSDSAAVCAALMRVSKPARKK
jgi:hypothetical protein